MRNHENTKMNLLLLRSIPIRKDLKSYYVSKYRHLCKHNGVDYANAKIKQVLAACKEYRASGSLPNTGVRNNGWFKMLLNYVSAQPHFAFNFLKGLYSWKGEINVDVTSSKFDNKLRYLRGNHETPKFMNDFMACLFTPLKKHDSIYDTHKTALKSSFHRYAKYHSLIEWKEYWRKMKSIYRVDRHSLDPTSGHKPVFPELYKDFDGSNSRSLERDIVNALTVLMVNTDISRTSKDLISSYLSKDLQDQYYSMMMEEWYPDYSCTDFMSGEYVGDIHYIPKSGTDYRPIAVPNRLFQQALVPIYRRLAWCVRRIPVDATFDQDRFNMDIQSRVTSDSRFVGSVDLSSATEHLPLDWIRPYLDQLHLNDEEEASKGLFYELSRARWNNDGYMSKWYVGQPLGSLPSFMVLALTHNLFTESLALACGYGHSPYRILGDDIVFFSRRLRNRYVQELSKRGIPLSLHKSYSGKLTEFAGKIFVKRMKPFHTPDHHTVTWQSLFDFQYSSGIRIPWNQLPRKFRNRFSSLGSQYGLPGQSLYGYTQLCCVYSRGSSTSQLSEQEGKILEKYFELLESGEQRVTGDRHTGIVEFQGKVLVVSDNKTDTNGYFTRFLRVPVPKWYKQKFRPTETDRVISTTIEAVREALV